jgi:uncharacterized iron-regulated protein
MAGHEAAICDQTIRTMITCGYLGTSCRRCYPERIRLLSENTMNAKPALFLLAALAAGPGAAATPHATPTCLRPAAWQTVEGERPAPVSAAALLSRMARQEVVLLGEQHDEEDHHRWQVQTLAALHASRPEMVIGFEAFPRRVQPALDRWVAGEITVKEFLAQAQWSEVWDMPAELYLPLFQFARINRIPMLALNVERSLTKAITEQGWDAVPEARREGVGRPATPAPAYLDVLFEVYREHQGRRGKEAAKAKRGDAAFRYFVESQTTWDRAMAEALARALAVPAGAKPPLVVGIMGSGHIRHGHGVPHQLRALGVKEVGTLLPVANDSACGELRKGFADAVFALPAPALAKPEPPRLGVLLDQAEGGVRITKVTADSLAEKSGLKDGDRLVELAGAPVTKLAAVSASIRAQPAGTWLPLRVRRGEETLELLIKFPPKP